MLNHDLYVFALALGISGFIAYKTFRWMLYEEIGPGAAALFLGFAIVVFFAMNNHDFLGRLVLHNDNRRAGDEKAFELLNAELQKQMETTRLLAETVKGAAESAHELAVEAQKKGQVALDAARKTHQQSEDMVSVTAWATWELLLGEFLEVEGYLRRWEEKNGLTRGRGPARSLTDLAQKLEPLEGMVPDTIKGLYFDRQRKYEILKRMKESSESALSRLPEKGFDLPAPPFLPLAVASNDTSSNPKRAQE